MKSKCENLIPVLLLGAVLVSWTCKRNPVGPNPSIPPDTTSHELTWIADTIGIYPSIIHGVWGTDGNNVYAVGLVFYSYSPYVASNILHWDGVNWLALNYLEGFLNSIYGFGPNDICAVGSWRVDNNLYALISHWDGNTWTTSKFQQFGNLWSIWGLSSTNLYCVGSSGLIIHYDGASWTQQQSGTTMDLRDVWGIDNMHIFVGGYEDSSGTGILLQSDGTTWKTVTTGGVSDSTVLFGGFAGLWSNSPDKIILVGALCYEGVPGNWKLSNIPYNSPGPNLYGLAAMNSVRGDGANNVFVCGDRDLIIHWNGSNWHIYNEFFDKTKQSSLTGIWVKDNNVFITGYENSASQAIVYRGIQ